MRSEFPPPLLDNDEQQVAKLTCWGGSEVLARSPALIKLMRPPPLACCSREQARRWRE